MSCLIVEGTFKGVTRDDLTKYRTNDNDIYIIVWRLQSWPRTLVVSGIPASWEEGSLKHASRLNALMKHDRLKHDSSPDRFLKRMKSSPASVIGLSGEAGFGCDYKQVCVQYELSIQSCGFSPGRGLWSLTFSDKSVRKDP